MKLDVYSLTIDFLEPILGTASADPDIYSQYIGTKRPVPLSPEQLADEVGSLPSADDDLAGRTVFHRENGRPFSYDYQIKGFWKEAGNFLKQDVKITNLRSKIDNALFVFPRRIFFEPRNGKMEESALERPLRAQTMQGPRVALARSEMLTGARLRCRVAVLGSQEITEKVLGELLTYGLVKGLGQWRNGSYGRFVGTLGPRETVEGAGAVAERLRNLREGTA